MVRYFALVFHYSFVLEGIDAVNGSAQHLIVEVLAIVCLAEKVAVVRHIEANAQVKVLAADKIGLHFELNTFI